MGIEDIKKQANQHRLEDAGAIADASANDTLAAVYALEAIGKFREASEMAGGLLYNAGLQKKYRDLANFLSLPDLRRGLAT